MADQMIEYELGDVDLLSGETLRSAVLVAKTWGRLSAEQHWFRGGLSSAGRPAQTISGRSRQCRAVIDVVVTPEASLFIHVKHQYDELGEISPFIRDGLALGMGLSFTLD